MAVKTNCTVNGKNYFRVTATLGRDSDGKLIRKSFYGNNKTEAENKKKEFLKDLENGLSVNADKVVFKLAVKTWFDEVVSVRVKPGTYERYESLYRLYIEPSTFAGMKVKSIKSIEIQKYYNELYYDKKKTHKTIHDINKLIKQFFNYCVDTDIILKNPISGNKITIPGKNEVEDKEIETYSKKEVMKLYNSTNHSKMYFIACASVGTGMRRGEVLGLKWSDIDSIKNTIFIQRTVRTVLKIDKDTGKRTWVKIFQTPKSKKSVRKIPLKPSLKNLLEELKKIQDKRKEDMGSSYMDNDLIFCRDDGTLVDEKKIQRDWKYFCDKNKLPYKNFHSLRHTYATIQFENNIPLKTVSELLGHSDIYITGNTYTHILKEHKELAIDILAF